MDSIIQGQRESYKKVNRTMRRRDGVMRVRYAISKKLRIRIESKRKSRKFTTTEKTSN